MYSSMIGGMLGSWAACVVIPLDWNRPWQYWPIPNSVGTIAGSILGVIIGFLFLCPILSHIGGGGSSAEPRTPVKTPAKSTNIIGGSAGKKANGSPLKISKKALEKSPKRERSAKEGSPVKKASKTTDKSTIVPSTPRRGREKSPSPSKKASSTPKKKKSPSPSKRRTSSRVGTPRKSA